MPIESSFTSIADLNASTDNWLLTSHPDLYLFGCLTELAVYTRDMEMAQMAGQRTQALIEQLQSSDNANAINGGPLTVRAR